MGTWTKMELEILGAGYPGDDLETLGEALPGRTLNAIRLKASRLNIKRVTPMLDIFLLIDRSPWINLIGPDGSKITIRIPGDDRR